ncbi:MAG: 50S ribosomal protein L6 [Fibromonadaceae bacterium]|jgi:large subunit ribosomal protein L6|nr:50S ribosomal protein L6 [Fibromonadaceae bacterium]
MSRIGKKAITIPEKVEVIIEGQKVSVKGPKGALSHVLHDVVSIEKTSEGLEIKRPNDQKFSRSIHGTSRALVANMVEGVSKGFQKTLEIVGVGYRAEQKGKDLNLVLGFSHPVEYKAPDGIELKASEDKLKVTISGIDKQKVGQVAAEIRKYRRPEPYKGKGIRYSGEYILRKQGKKTGK